MYPLIIAGVISAIVAVVFLYLRHTLDGPNAPIVVVDRRTMRLAGKRITEAAEAGDWSRAHAGVIALLSYLRYQIRTGPKRHRVAYASAAERWELVRSDIRQHLGLPDRIR